MSKLVCMPVRVALIIVMVLENGEKLVCKEPNKLVTKLVFCHKVMVEEVTVFVMRCKFGNQAAKATIVNATIIVTNIHFGCRIIFTSVAIVIGAEDLLQLGMQQIAVLQQLNLHRF